MDHYEIRIVRKADNTQMVVSAKLMGDHAAIRRAQFLAGENDRVEVRRGMTCIYSTVRESVY